MNPGLLLGLNLDPEIFPLVVTVGGAVPLVSGENTTETTGSAAVSTKVNAMAYSANALVEVAPEVEGFTWKTGIPFNFTSYGRVKTETTTETETGTHNSIMNLGLYSGIIKEMEESGLLLSVVADAGLARTQTRLDDADVGAGNFRTADQRTHTITYGLTSGMEKTWERLRFFDAMYARAGLAYDGSWTVGRASGDTAGYEYAARVMNPANRTGFAATIGGGLHKGIFTFDVNVSPTAMLSLFKLGNGTFNAAGADFIEATLTFDFNKDASTGWGSSSAAASVPSYPTTPAASEPPSATEPGTGLGF